MTIDPKTPEDELVDVLVDALFEMLLSSDAANDVSEGGDGPQDAA